MQAKINVDRKAAMLAGLDNGGEYTIEFDPAALTPEQREVLAGDGPNKDGVFVCPDSPVKITRGDQAIHKYTESWSVPVTQITAPTVAQLVRRLDELIAGRANVVARLNKRDAEQEQADRAEIDAILARPAGDNMYVNNSTRPPSLQNRIAELARKYPDLLAGVMAEATAIRDAWLAERDARNERIAAEKKAAAERRTGQISGFVAEHMDENARARHALGLLDEDEILAAMRNLFFAGLADVPRYKMIQAADFCECDDDDRDTSYSVDDADTLSAVEYDRLAKIKKLVHEAVTVTARRHHGHCGGCENDMDRTGYRVTGRMGEIEMTREYAG